jgi:hypothetical protein
MIVLAGTHFMVASFHILVNTSFTPRRLEQRHLSDLVLRDTVYLRILTGLYGSNSTLGLYSGGNLFKIRPGYRREFSLVSSDALKVTVP